MEDWRATLGAAPAPPADLLAFAASQPTLAELWKNSPRGDWIVWLAANGFAGEPNPGQIVRGALILGDYSREPDWRQMLHLRPTPLHVLRRFVEEPNLDQLVPHAYVAILIATLPALLAYARLAARPTGFRQSAMTGVFVLVSAVVFALLQIAYRRAARRAASRLTPAAAVALALDVARAATDRGGTRRTADGAGFMRKLFDPPPTAPS